MLILIGCKQIISESEILGHYEGRMSETTVLLKLQENHTYSEEFEFHRAIQEAITAAGLLMAQRCDFLSRLFQRLMADQLVMIGLCHLNLNWATRY